MVHTRQERLLLVPYRCCVCCHQVPERKPAGMEECAEWSNDFWPVKFRDKRPSVTSSCAHPRSFDSEQCMFSLHQSMQYVRITFEPCDLCAVQSFRNLQLPNQAPRQLLFPLYRWQAKSTQALRNTVNSEQESRSRLCKCTWHRDKHASRPQRILISMLPTP